MMDPLVVSKFVAYHVRCTPDTLISKKDRLVLDDQRPCM